MEVARSKEERNMELGAFDLINTELFLDNQEAATGVQLCDACQICDNDGGCWDCVDNE